MDIRPFVTATDSGNVAALFASVTRRTGDWPLSEHKRRDLETGDGFIGLVGIERGIVRGYAHISTGHGSGEWALEIVTDEDAGTRWAALAAAAARVAGPDRSLNYWPGPDHAALARRRGWEERRRIVRYETSLPARLRQDAPSGIAIGPLGADYDAAMLAVNNRAFAGHPEQGNWSRAHLRRLREAPWHDPDGTLGAWDGAALVGFCWSKLHPDAVGEIYLIGVDPDARGRGIGTALVAAALAHLYRNRGATRGLLYVDGANDAARTMYRRAGFRPGPVLVCYRVPGIEDGPKC